MLDVNTIQFLAREHHNDLLQEAKHRSDLDLSGWLTRITGWIKQHAQAGSRQHTTLRHATHSAR